MKIKCLNLGIIDENCYLISSDSAAIVIDPGCYSKELFDFLITNNKKERMILITHAHFDHIGGAKRLSDETETKIAIGKFDAEGLSNPRLNLSSSFGMPLKPFSADILLSDDQEFTVGDITVTAIHTPGHTKGSICYLIEDCLFSGDMLFFESFGRTDFPGGNAEHIKESFYSLISRLPHKTSIYPGHGQITTIANEKDNNPLNYMSVL